MAKVAEVTYHPPVTLDGKRFHGFYTFPASPLEYLSPRLVARIMKHWPGAKASPKDWDAAEYYLMGVKACLVSLDVDGALDADGLGRFAEGAIDDLNTLIEVGLPRHFDALMAGNDPDTTETCTA